MKVTFSRRALKQLDAIFAYIARDNLKAAAAVVEHIEVTAAMLGAFPSMGRPTDEPGIRLRVITKYPYLIFYKVLAETEVRILRVLHGAQDRN